MSELTIVQSINHWWQGTALDVATIFISYIPFLVTLWLAVITYIFIGDKKLRWQVLLGILSAFVLHLIITDGIFKHGLVTLFSGRPRPYLIDPINIAPLGTLLTDSSFPSGHVAATVAILTVLTCYYQKLLIPAIIFVFLMGFARLHNGMHFPTDVLAGMVLGLGYGWVGLYLGKYLYKKLSNLSRLFRMGHGG